MKQKKKIIVKRLTDQKKVKNCLLEKKTVAEKVEKNLFEKILEVQKKIAAVKKWGWDKAQLSFRGPKYSYRSFHTLMEKIGGFLREEDLLLRFNCRILDAEESVKIFREDKTARETTKEITSRAVKFLMEAIIIDAKNPSALPYKVSMIAVGEDNQDISKALGKANTYTKRYLILNIFAISDKEETVEEEAEAVLKEEKKQPPRAPARAPVKAPVSANDFKLMNS